MSYRCPQCDFTTQFNSVLLMHIQLHHASEADRFTNPIQQNTIIKPSISSEVLSLGNKERKGFSLVRRSSSATRLFSKIRARIARSRTRLFDHPEEIIDNSLDVLNDITGNSDCTSKGLNLDPAVSKISALTTTLEYPQTLKETYGCHLCEFQADRITVLDRHLLNDHKIGLDNLLKLVLARTKESLADENMTDVYDLRQSYYKQEEAIEDGEFVIETVQPKIKILKHTGINTDLRWTDIPDLKDNCKKITKELEKLINYPIETSNRNDFLSKMEILNDCMCKFVDSSNTLKKVFDTKIVRTERSDKFFDLGVGDQETPKECARACSERMDRSRHKYNRFREYNLCPITTYNDRKYFNYYDRSTKDFGCQYNYKRDNYKTRLYADREQEVRYLRFPKIYSLRSRSFTDVGVSKIKTVQKKKIRKIYLPETDDKAVGSDVLTCARRTRNYKRSSYYDYKRTSSKCVGGGERTIEPTIHAQLSPVIQTASAFTSPDGEEHNKETGINTVEKDLITTTTQVENQYFNIQNLKQVITIQYSEQKVSNKYTVDIIPEKEKKNNNENVRNIDCVFSSDSLVEHVHNFESPENYEDNNMSIDFMENKLEREYRMMFAPKKYPSVEKTAATLTSESVLRRRFEALRRSLAKKEENKKNPIVYGRDSKTSMASKKDASIVSDPPSLEARSYTCTKVYSPCPSYDQNKNLKVPVSQFPPERNVKKEKEFLNEQNAKTAEDEGVKGMFKLWGKRFDFEENTQNTQKVHEIKTERQGANQSEIDDKKDLKKYFFFKKKIKEKEKCMKTKKSVTTGRCEVNSGLTVKFGASKKHAPKKNEPAPICKKISDKYDGILQKAWLERYMDPTNDSRKSLKIRWNNRKFNTSSSTVFELMDNVYRQTRVVFKSQSEISTGTSLCQSFDSYSKPFNYKQDIETWMVFKLIPEKPIELPIKVFNKANNKVNIAQRKCFMDKSRAFARKLEIILHSKNFVSRKTVPSSEYLKIDIPKDFFEDSGIPDGQHESSDSEEVYKIVEYESPEFDTKFKEKGIGDYKTVDSDITNETDVKKPPARDVETQGSHVYVPNRCDVVEVGIITQDLRDFKKPIIKIPDYFTDEESESTLKNLRLKCEFAESYLRDYYRHWVPVGAELFSWCLSDSHIKCCSEVSQLCDQNPDIIFKSCPNIIEDYQTTCPNQMSSCTCAAENNKSDSKSKKKEKKPSKHDERRMLPKDSFEVLKRRKLYAKNACKTKWLCQHEQFSATSSIDCRQGSKTKRPCKKHVSLPSCDYLNQKDKGILQYKGNSCEFCKRLNDENEASEAIQANSGDVVQMPNDALCRRVYTQTNRISNCQHNAVPRPTCLDRDSTRSFDNKSSSSASTEKVCRCSSKKPDVSSCGISCNLTLKPDSEECNKNCKCSCSVDKKVKDTQQSGEPIKAILKNSTTKCKNPECTNNACFAIKKATKPKAPKTCPYPGCPYRPASNSPSPPRQKITCSSIGSKISSVCSNIAKNASMSSIKNFFKPPPTCYNSSCSTPRPSTPSPRSSCKPPSPPSSTPSLPTSLPKCPSPPPKCPSPPSPPKRPCPPSPPKCPCPPSPPKSTCPPSPPKNPCPPAPPKCPSPPSPPKSTCPPSPPKNSCPPAPPKCPSPPSPPKSTCPPSPPKNSCPPPKKKKCPKSCPGPPSPQCSPRSSHRCPPPPSPSKRPCPPAPPKCPSPPSHTKCACPPSPPKNSCPPAPPKCPSPPSPPKSTCPPSPLKNSCPPPKKKKCPKSCPGPPSPQCSPCSSQRCPPPPSPPKRPCPPSNPIPPCPKSYPRPPSSKSSLPSALCPQPHSHSPSSALNRSPCPSPPRSPPRPPSSTPYPPSLLRPRSNNSCSKKCCPDSPRSSPNSSNPSRCSDKCCPDSPTSIPSSPTASRTIPNSTNASRSSPGSCQCLSSMFRSLKKGVSQQTSLNRDILNQTETSNQTSINDTKKRNVTGMFLRKPPAKPRCATECSSSTEKINIKVQDGEGNTLYERRDYTAHMSTLVGGIYDINRMSTPTIQKDLNEMDYIETGKTKSEVSTSNQIEIQLKLKLPQGDKTNDMISNDDVDEKNELTTQKAYLFKETNTPTVEDDSDKNDIKIKIIIKNMNGKADKKIKEQIDEFTTQRSDEYTQQITDKFHTVSTVFSELSNTKFVMTTKNKSSEKVKSEHIFHTVDTSVVGMEQDKVDVITEMEKPEQTDESLITDIEDSYINKENVQIMSEEIISTDTENAASFVKQFSSVINDNALENIIESPLNDSSNTNNEEIKKPKTRRQKKDLLKKVLEKATNMKGKRDCMKELKNMLKIILTSDSSGCETTKNSKALAKDVTYASLEPNYFSNSQSLSNYISIDSVFNSYNDLTYPTQENSNESNDTDSNCCGGAGKCFCSTFAEKLNISKTGGCCCRSRKVDEECCTIKNNIYDYKAECSDMQTQKSINKLSKILDAKIEINKSSKLKIDMKTMPMKIEVISTRKRDKNTKIHGKQFELRKFNRNTMLGISNDDKIYLVSNKEKTQTEVYSNPADILQSYVTKKAVLEIYTERRISVDGEHLVAKLPKFMYEREKDIDSSYAIDDHFPKNINVSIKR